MDFFIITSFTKDISRIDLFGILIGHLIFGVALTKLLNKAAKANGRTETVSYLNRAAKIKSKIYSNTKVNCFRCNGAGFLRISLDETKTCLSCYGKGFLIKEIQQV